MQLISPICDIFEWRISNDTRTNYLSDVDICACKYAGTIYVVSSYDHSFNTAKIQELAWFNDFLIRDSMIMCSNGKLRRKWLSGVNYN